MPLYNPGAGPDEVRLEINGKKINIFTGYTIRKSILTQPAQFTLRFGYGEIGPTSKRTKDLLAMVQPHSKFKLYINNCLQQTGFTDGFQAGGTATEIEVFGRDNMALIHDAYLLQDIAFENDTYKSMTEKVLKNLNINETVFCSDEANLKLGMGVGIQNYENPVTIDQIEEIDTPEATSSGSGQPTNKIIKRAITAKLAETYYQFLQRQYRRAGLFLWAGGDGSFILSEPNDTQNPSYRIQRGRGLIRNAVTVTKHMWRNDITTRYTSAHVYGRSQGRKGGRAKAKGEIEHDVLFDLFGGDFKPISFRDVNVSTRAQAEFYARRKIAEFNRAGWQLHYTVPGHTCPNIVNGLTSTWCPNTMVEVKDDELGINGNYYLEEVLFTSPPCETTLTLMDPAHLIFQSDDDEAF